MNHPKREAWVPYLFGEATPEARRELQQHFQGCAACRDEVARWERTIARLDAWRLPRATRSGDALAPVFRWAFAAAVVLVLGLGFGLGRLSAPVPDVAQFREAIEPRLREELRAELAQMLRDEMAATASATLVASGRQTRAWLAEYARAVDARLEVEKAERIADCLTLKRDVDTIAIQTDAGLRDTGKWLLRLAQYRPEPVPQEEALNQTIRN